MAVPLTTHTQPAATLLCWTSVPRERRGQRGPSSGHRVRRGDRVARGTAAQGAHRLPCTLRFRCLSIRSFGLPPLPASAQPAPNLRTSDEAACTPAEVRLRPPREEPEPGGCKSVRPVPTSPYTADWATKYRVAIPPAARGNSAQVQGEASPGPPPRRPWPGPASAQPFPPAFSPPRPPPPPALGFKSQRLRSAVGRRGLRAPEAWPRSCPRAEPRPRTPVPPSPPSLPRPALPEYPSP